MGSLYENHNFFDKVNYITATVNEGPQSEGFQFGVIQAPLNKNKNKTNMSKTDVAPWCYKCMGWTDLRVG